MVLSPKMDVFNVHSLSTIQEALQSDRSARELFAELSDVDMQLLHQHVCRIFNERTKTYGLEPFAVLNSEEYIIVALRFLSGEELETVRKEIQPIRRTRTRVDSSDKWAADILGQFSIRSNRGLMKALSQPDFWRALAVTCPLEWLYKLDDAIGVIITQRSQSKNASITRMLTNYENVWWVTHDIEANRIEDIQHRCEGELARRTADEARKEKARQLAMAALKEVQTGKKL